MRSFRPILVGLAALAVLTAAAAASAPVSAPYPVAPTTRDGRNDFNFEFGTWRTHYRLLEDRLVGSHQWYDCYGTSVIRPRWGGSANLEDGDLTCPNRYVGGMTLRTYDAATHQWTLWWGTRKLGVSPPSQVGHFNAGGVGDFYSYDSWKGRPVITRFEWSVVRGNPHFEQAFSTDGGKTWEVNWTTDYVRVSPSSKGVWNAVEPAGDGHEAFDFLLGAWNVRMRRLAHPLAHDGDWETCSGRATVRPFWGGGAQLQDGDISCPSRRFRALSLRLYDPATRRWKLYFASQKNGLDPNPQIGTFGANGTGEFFGPDTYEGRAILVRYRWTPSGGAPHFEQAFSLDAGKTWETNWIADFTRPGGAR